MPIPQINDKLDSEIGQMLSSGGSAANVIAHILRNKHNVQTVYTGADNPDTLYFDYTRNNNGNPLSATRFAGVSTRRYNDPSVVGVSERLYKNELINAGEERYKSPYSGYYYSAATLAKTYQSARSESQFYDVLSQYSAANVQAHLAESNNPLLRQAALGTVQFTRTEGTLQENFRNNAVTLALSRGAMLNAELGGQDSPFRRDTYNLTPLQAVDQVGKAKQEKLMLRNSQPQWSMMPGQTTMDINGVPSIVSRIALANQNQLIGAGGGVIMAAEPFSRGTGSASQRLQRNELAGFFFGGKGRSFSGENIDIGRVMGDDGQVTRYLGERMGGAAETSISGERVLVGHGQEVVGSLTNFFENPEIAGFLQQTQGAPTFQEMKAKIGLGFSAPLLAWNGKGDQQAYESQLATRTAARQDVMGQLTRFKNMQAQANGFQGNYTFQSYDRPNITAEVDLDVKMNAAIKGFSAKSAPAIIDPSIGERGLTAIAPIDVFKNKYVAGQQNMQVWQNITSNFDANKSYLNPAEQEIAQRIMGSGLPFEQAYAREQNSIAQTGNIFTAIPAVQALMPEPRTNSGRVSGGDLLSMHMLGNPQMKRYVENVAKEGFSGESGSVLAALTNRADRTIQGPLGLTSDATLDDLARVLRENDVAEDQAVRIGEQVIPSLRAIGTQGPVAASVLAYAKAGSREEMLARGTELRATLERERMGPETLKDVTSVEATTAGGLLRYRNPEDPLFQGERGQDNVYLGRRDVEAIAHQLSNNYGAQVTPGMVENYFGENEVFGEFSGFPRRGGAHVARYKLYEGEDYNSEYAGSSALWALEQFRDSDYDRALQQVGLKAMKDKSGKDTIVPVAGGRAAFYSQRPLEGRVLDSLSAATGPEAIYRQQRDLKDVLDRAPSVLETVLGIDQGEGRRVAPLRAVLPGSSRDQNVLAAFRQEAGISPEEAVMQILREKNPGEGVGPAKLASSYLEMETNRGQASIYGMTKTMQHAFATRVNYKDYVAAAKASNPYYEKAGIDPYAEAAMSFETPYQKAIDFEVVEPAIREAVSGNAGLFKSTGIREGNKGESAETVASTLMRAYMTTGMADWNALGAMLTPEGGDIAATAQRLQKYNQDRPLKDRGIDAETRQDPNYSTAPAVTMARMHLAMNFFRDENFYGAKDNPAYQAQRQTALQTLKEDPDSLEAMMAFRRSSMGEDFWPVAQPGGVIGMIEQGNLQAAGVSPGSKARAPNRQPATSARPAGTKNMPVPEMYRLMRGENERGEQETQFVSASSAQNLIDDAYDSRLMGTLNMAFKGIGKLSFDNDALKRGREAETELEEYAKTHPEMAAKLGQRVPSADDMNARKLNRQYGYFESDGTPVKTSLLHDYLRWDKNNKKLYAIDQKTSSKGFSDDQLESYVLQQSSYAHSLTQLARKGKGEGAKYYLQNVAGFDEPTSSEIISTLRDQGIETIQPQIFGTKSSEPVESGQFYDLPMMSMAEVGRGLYKAVLARNQGVSEQAANALNLQWEFDEDGKQAHAVVKSYTGDTPLTLTPEAGYTTQSAVQKEQKRLSDYTEYTAAREAEIEPGEQKKPASTMAQEYLAEPSVGPQPQAGGGAGDGAKTPPIDTPAAPTSPGEPPESNGDTPQSVQREQGTINRRNFLSNRPRTGSGRFKVGEADQASQLLSRLFTPEGLARPGLNPAREVAKFKGIGTDMDRYATEMYHAMSGDFSQSDLKGQRRLADQGRRANEPGWTDEARAITQAISENVHQGISKPSDAIIRGELGKNFSELISQMYPGGTFSGGVGEADVMSKVGKSSAMVRALNNLPTFAMGQVGNKGNLERLLHSIKNIASNTPLSDDVKKLLLGEEGKPEGSITHDISQLLAMTPGELKAETQRRQRESTGTASKGAQIDPVMLGGEEVEQSKNYRKQLERMTKLMGENGDELEKNIKSQKDYREVVKDIVGGSKGLKEAIGQMNDLAASGELAPDIASRVKDATRSAKSVLSAAEASVQRGGSIGSFGAERWGDKFAEKALTDAEGDGEGGKRGGVASFANRMLSGYFAFQTLRTLRYTFNPVMDAGQQNMAGQMETVGSINALGSRGDLGMINGYMGAVGLANAGAGFRQNAGAFTAGVNNLAGAMGIGYNTGAGPLGALATVGLPAIGAGGITLAGLGMSFGGAVAGPVAAAVTGLTAIGGAAAYYSGARSDVHGAINYAYNAKRGVTSPTEDFRGWLAIGGLEGAAGTPDEFMSQRQAAELDLVGGIAGLPTQGVRETPTQARGRVALEQLDKYGPFDQRQMGFDASFVATNMVTPQYLVDATEGKLDYDSARGISNLVFSKTRGGAGTETILRRLADLKLQQTDPEKYLSQQERLAALSGDIRPQAGLEAIYSQMKGGEALSTQQLSERIGQMTNIGGGFNLQALSAFLGKDRIMQGLGGSNGVFVGQGLQSLGMQGAGMLSMMGISPTQTMGMMNTPQGQFMAQSLASGNPMAMTAAMQGGLLPVGGGGGFMPMMDMSTGAGLFQRSMWGMTGASQPTWQQAYNWFGGANAQFSGGQAQPFVLPGGQITSTGIAGRNAWSNISEGSRQAITNAAMGNTFGGVGGSAGLQALSNQWSFETNMRLQGAGAALQAQGARLQHEFTINYAQPNEFMGIEMSYAQAKGGVVNTEWMQEHGIPAYNAGRGQIAWSRAQLAMEEENQAAQSSQQRTRLGWQMQDLMKNWSQFRTQTGWQREDFATQGERMQYNRGYQQWQFQFQAQDMALQRQYSAEDYAYGKQVRQLQYGWQMEDYDEGIRRSTGYQRKQLVKQRDRATEMQNIEEGQEDRVRKRQEEAEKRQEEAFKKQIEHWKQTLRFEDEDFKKQRERFEEQTKWREEDFSTQRSRLQQEMAWAEEAAARAKKSLEIRKEQIDAEESQMETVHAAKLVMFEAEKVLEEEKFKLSQIIIGVTKEEQERMEALQQVITKMRDEEAKRVEKLNDLQLKFFQAMVDLLNRDPRITWGQGPSGEDLPPPPQPEIKAAGGYGRKGNLVGENGMEILGGNGYVWPTKYLTPKANDLSDQTITIEAKQPIEINGQKVTDVLMTFIIPAVALQGRRSLRR